MVIQIFIHDCYQTCYDCWARSFDLTNKQTQTLLNPLKQECGVNKSLANWRALLHTHRSFLIGSHVCFVQHLCACVVSLLMMFIHYHMPSLVLFVSFDFYSPINSNAWYWRVFEKSGEKIHTNTHTRVLMFALFCGRVFWHLTDCFIPRESCFHSHKMTCLWLGQSPSISILSHSLSPRATSLKNLFFFFFFVFLQQIILACFSWVLAIHNNWSSP